MAAATQSPENTALARLGLRLSNWFEKWFPDAFALALAAVASVFVATLLAGSTVLDSAQRFGGGFWDSGAGTGLAAPPRSAVAEVRGRPREVGLSLQYDF